MKYFNRTISAIMFAVLLISAAIVYICPMRIEMASRQASHCAGHVSTSVLSSESNSMDCFNSILDFSGQTNNFFNLVYSLLFLVVVAIFSAFSGKKSFAQIQSDLVKFRHRYREYLTSIRLLHEKKFREFLTILRSTTVVSIA